MSGYLAMRIMDGAMDYLIVVRKYPQFKGGIDEILKAKGREDLIKYETPMSDLTPSIPPTPMTDLTPAKESIPMTDLEPPKEVKEEIAIPEIKTEVK